MKGLRKLPLLSGIVAALIAAGCSGECYENKNALPLASFRTSDTTEVRMDSLRVLGAGAPGDSTLWEGTTPVEELYLPFRVDSDTTAYVFEHLRTALRDTVTFIYSRDPVLASYECGVSYVYQMKSITTDGILIDSVTCPGGRITNKNSVNLIIYLKDGNAE